LAKHFDATLKDLLEADPQAWLDLLRLDADGPIRVVDSDLATVTAAADKVLRIEGEAPRLVHLEFQASHDLNLPRRLLWYNVLLDYRHGLPVFSAAVLVRPEANSPAFDGILRRALPESPDHLTFRYAVVRIWEEPVETLLEGPLGTLPLAPISDVEPRRLPDVLRRLARRLEGEADPARSARLLSATGILLGMRHPQIAIHELFEEVFDMSWQIHGIEETPLGRDLIGKGLALGLASERRLILNLGRSKFGPPGRDVLEEFERIDDLDRLEALGLRLLSVTSWEELLAEPTTPPDEQG
jgi:hypothetical protein